MIIREAHTLCVRSSTAVLNVCMPPMAVPMRMPQRAGSRWLSGVSHDSPACSSACGVAFAHEKVMAVTLLAWQVMLCSTREHEKRSREDKVPSHACMYHSQ